MSAPSAAIGAFPYAHPTVEDMNTVQSLISIGSPETSERFHCAAARDAIDAVRPARAALARGRAVASVSTGAADNSRILA